MFDAVSGGIFGLGCPRDSAQRLRLCFKNMRKTFLDARLKQKNIRHNNKSKFYTIHVKESKTMNNLTPELIAKAKEAKSAEELLALAE